MSTLTEQEILTYPIVIEVTPNGLVIRASRAYKDKVKLLLQQLQHLGVAATITSEGLYCHHCPDNPVFKTQAEWERHNIFHQRYCEFPGCTEVFVPQEIMQDAYLCPKHEEMLDELHRALLEDVNN